MEAAKSLETADSGLPHLKCPWRQLIHCVFVQKDPVSVGDRSDLILSANDDECILRYAHQSESLVHHRSMTGATRIQQNFSIRHGAAHFQDGTGGDVWRARQQPFN
jgi:hypothetical protein